MILAGMLIGSAIYTGWSARKARKKRLGYGKKSQAVRAVTLVEPRKKLSAAESDNKRDKRYLAISLTSLGTAAGASLAYPALGMVSAVGLVYVSLPFFRDAYRSVLQERRIRVPVLDAVLATVCIAQGYYLSWALVCSLIYGSRRILKKTEDSSRDSLLNIFGQQVDKVWVSVDGTEVEVTTNQLQLGDIVVVHAGEVVPVDGLVIKGHSSVDQHLLTGESQPAEKAAGDQVMASTLVLTGEIHIRVEQTGSSTAAARITEVLAQTADYKSSLQSRGEMYADKAALPTLCLSAAAMATVGAGASVTVLNAAFAFYMRVLGPIGMLNYLKQAFRQGILIKDGRVLDLLSQVDTVVFDKTGTLTHTQPHVGNIHAYHGYTADEVLQLAASAEYKQTHPVALAILQEARYRQLDLPEIEETSYQVGYGLMVNMGRHTIRVGSGRFMALEAIEVPDEIQGIQEESHSLIMVAVDDRLVGVIEMLPTVREEAKGVVDRLHKQFGMSTVIISGDHATPTRQMAAMLGIDDYFAETLPEQKAEIIQRLKNEGRFVCYIGDGINDSIALKQAQVSISFSGASSVATDTAQVILMNDDLQQIIELFKLADTFDVQLRKTLKYSVLPGVATVTGAFFLHFTLIYSIILNQLGFVSGLVSITRPVGQQLKQSRK